MSPTVQGATHVACTKCGPMCLIEGTPHIRIEISGSSRKKMRAKEPLGGLRTFAKSLALLAASPFRAALNSLKTGSISIGLYPVYIGVGRVLAEFGYSNEQYRNPEKN